MEKYWSIVNIDQQDLETRKGDKERQVIMIGVRKALSGHGALSLLSLGVSVGLEEVAHGGMTLRQMNERERAEVGRTQAYVPRK